MNGVLNAVQVVSDAAGTTLFSGPGAGGEATASAVLADVVGVAGQRSSGRAAASRMISDVPVLPITDVRCAHYMRIPTRDEAGVFARVAEAMSRHQISIEAVIQKEPTTEVASIVLLTEPVLEAHIVAALQEVQQLPQVAGKVARIRVETGH